MLFQYIRLIARFSYKNTEQPATSWVEMFQKVLQILYAEDKNVITKLAASKEDNIALHFSMNESIENETDWLQMAKFHAHWSKKFYDVIVPYLR